MPRARAVVGWGVLAAVPLLFLVVFFLVPVTGMIGRGLRPDGVWDLAGAWEVLTRARTAKVIGFTLFTAVVGTAITVALGVPTAYCLYRLRLPGATLLRGLLVMPFVLPTVVVGVAFRTLLAQNGPLGWLGLDGTPTAIIAALVFFNLSVVIRVVGTAWAGLDPRPEQAAASLGASPGQVFRTITLPSLRPAIISATSVVFLFCATAFGVVLTLGGVRYSTIETEIYLLTTNFLDLQGAAVLSILQFVMVLVLLALVGRVRRTGAATSAVPTPTRIRRSDAGALVALAASVLLVITPLATLVARSLQVQGNWSLDNYRGLTAVTGDNALPVTVWQALSTSWRIAIDASVLAVGLGLIVAVLVSRRPRSRSARRMVGLLDGVFMLPLGISAVTVGFGFLITLDKPPFDFRDSVWLIPVAQAMVALPLVVRTLAPALRTVDQRQREAAAALGASPLRVALTVDVVAAWRPFLAAIGFALAVSLGEFGATSFLARPDDPTLPVAIYQLIGHPGAANFGMALAASVVLAAVTGAIMAGVDRLGGRTTL
ncbi:thiamine transport system permease protein [Branchiibius hedensis]|uniref:Thiamine transport system permease protein n=1 Tax=Branchiibius hedensis TaxID=672460 RepID=A0A2Y8ZUK3_9MICO|nr:iron ABC transporter permease [Branchiibius hedensis]PWJ26794.1 thiamine transport system permease protein [Branchiibius hedensis]SSA35605.1 thiamine transport system permease protein [Branchiibius hedensis]